MQNNSTLPILEEGKIKDLRKLFLMLSENTNDVFLVFDMNLKCKYVTPSVENLIGYTAEQFLNLTFDDYITPNSIEIINNSFTEQLELKSINGKVSTKFSSFEIEIIQKNGNIITGELKTSFLRDSNGSLFEIIVILQDITKEKTMKNKLVKSEEQYRQLIKTMNDGMVVQDKNYRITFVNDKFSEMIKYSKNELIGHYVFDFFDDLNRHKYDNEMKKRKKGASEHYEIEFTKKNGEKLLVFVSPSPIFDSYGYFKGSICTLSDMTERKKNEYLLKESEEKYRSLVETSGDIIFEMDLKGDFLFINSAVTEISGYSVEEIMKLNGLRLIHPDDYKSALKNSILVGKGQRVNNIEYRSRRKNGSYTYFSTNISPVFDSQNKIIAIQGIARDITLRKKTENQLRESEERYRLQFEQTLDAIIIANPETGVIIDCNYAATKLFGRNKSELIGKHQKMLHPHEITNGGFSETFKKHLREKMGNVLETQIINKAGKIRDVTIKANIIKLQGKKFLQGVFKDITEIKIMENENEEARRELVKAQMLLSSTIKQNLSGVIVASAPDMKIQIVNWAALEIFGIQDKNIVNIEFEEYFSLWKLYYPDMTPYKPEDFPLARVIRKGEIIKNEEVLIRQKNGSERWALINSTPLYDYKIEIVAGMMVITDITNRKRAEQKLRENEKYLTTILNSILTGVVIIDEETHKITDVNPLAAEMIGSSSEEIVGKFCYRLICPAEKGKCPISDLGQIINTSERVLINTMGEKIPILKTVTKISLNNHNYLVNSFINLTDHKRAEEELRESEEKYRSLIETSPNIIFKSDLKGNFLYVNDMVESYLGWSPEEFLKINSLRLIHPDDYVSALKQYNPLTNGQSVQNVEYRIRTKDNSYIYVLINATPVFNNQQEVIGMIGVGSDITHLKKIESDLKKNTEKLERSNIELQQFAYIASHDLREPLRTVSGYLQLLERRYKEKLDEKARKYINSAVNGSYRMENLVEGLLQYSRIGTSVKEFYQVNMENVLKEVITNLKAAIRESNAEITSSVLPPIKGDYPQLVQLLQNLISNSIKFQKDNTPRIHVGIINNNDQNKDQKNDDIVFFVKDNGIGIDLKHFNKLFKTFKRLHSRMEYKGTGIGLALCKKIVERHGGRIWLESEIGKGSTFYFSIPRRTTPS
ncbi:MAG: PAS domain S-box protein [Promethearchaeota archaeon]